MIPTKLFSDLCPVKFWIPQQNYPFRAIIIESCVSSLSYSPRERRKEDAALSRCILVTTMNIAAQTGCIIFSLFRFRR